MDFDESAGLGGQLWTVGIDGSDACGYRVQWWLDPSELGNIQADEGCSSDQSTGTGFTGTAANPHQLITPNPVIQIQPIANEVTYHLRVEKLNSLGQVCSAANEMTFEGGDGSRVDELRSTLTFFDDFNLPEGAPNQLKWNHASGPQTDPRFNLFFINPQCHVHTLNGTRNDGAGDKSQVAQRSRKPILIEQGVRRRIVFDMDGLFSGRSVWYLDLNPVETDLMSHLSFFDEDGDTGLPANVFRIKSIGHEISVSLINSAGASYRIASSHLPDFDRAMSTNVRRSFDVQVGTDGVEILVDGTSVLNADFPPDAFQTGIYYPLWSTVGYNTSKDDNPYFLSHWDNFGFDGPDINPKSVHNYVTQIAGSDLQIASEYSESAPTFNIPVPDDIRPTGPGITHEVWLVFTYSKNDYTSFNIESGDHLLFNGNSFPLPQGANNSDPIVPGLVTYDGSPISNRIKIGEVEMGGNSPVLIGNNTIQFFANYTGIINVHLEVHIPESAFAPPPYTEPAEIHPFVHHHDLPKLGPPAKIVSIDNELLSEGENGELLGPDLSDSIAIEILVGNTSWANWAPQWLNIPANSAELWSTGSTPGIKSVQLYMRPKGDGNDPGMIIASLQTNLDAPAPQVRYSFNIDTRNFPNGDYQLFVQATNDKDVMSHPSYSGFAFKWDAEEISGAYYPIEVKINNTNNFVFKGTNGPMWTNESSWEGGHVPPPDCAGPIIIDADCIVPAGHPFAINKNCLFIVSPGKVLDVQK